MGKHIEPILFSVEHEPYGVFCNESPYAIRVGGITWPTVAHYLLYEQYPGRGVDLVRRVSDPGNLDSLARELAPERLNWDAARDEYMERALRAKFSQHLDLEGLLNATGERPLVYSSRSDRYYGVGPRGYGHNMLGRLLMRVRSDARARLTGISLPGLAIRELNRFEEAARQNPTDEDALAALADAYLSASLYERASAVARRAVAINPDSEWGHRALARALMSLSRYEDAVVPLRALARLDPRDAQYLQWLADTHRLLGNSIKAKVYASRANRLVEEDEDE